MPVSQATFLNTDWSDWLEMTAENYKTGKTICGLVLFSAKHMHKTVYTNIALFSTITQKLLSGDCY